jgi:hypothetical protein
VSLRIGDIIFDARNEHAAFSRDRHGNRTLVDYLSERHRVYYKELADELKDRLSVELLVEGNVLAIRGSDGVVYALETGHEGHQIVVGRLDGIPYLAAALLTMGDFTLPPDSLQIISIWATLTTQQALVPVSWLPQSKRPQYGMTSERLPATVNGFQLKPLVNPAGTQSLWDSVESLTVAYVPEPVELEGEDPATLDREIEIPSIYGHVLKWELTAFMARREAATNKDFPPALVKFYLEEAVRARETTKAGAIMDHRIVKQHRATRNR